jgi:hypothetical protein
VGVFYFQDVSPASGRIPKLFGGGYEVWLKLTKVRQSNFRQGPSPEFLSWVNKFGIIK